MVHWAYSTSKGKGRSSKKTSENSDSEEDHPAKKKRRNTTEERMDRVDDIVDELRVKHKSVYSTLQYRVWAETVVGGRHESLDSPPKGSFFLVRNVPSLQKGQ